MGKLRIDKMLANSGFGTRKEVRELIKSGCVEVSGQLIRSPDFQVDPERDRVLVNGVPFIYREFYYLMMNKPAGVISATRDDFSKTVIDLLPAPYSKMNLFPIGRLDKDTEGLLILSNDGQLAHRLLSPRHLVPKTYYAVIEGHVNDGDRETFKRGIPLEEDFTTLPAELHILEAGELSKVHVTIYEGKFHQVKRMFEYVGKRVLYLKRLSMGGLFLDEGLQTGDFRELTEEEIELLKKQ